MKVLRSDGCDCNGGTPGLEIIDPRNGIVVRSKPGIDIGNIINPLEENGKRVYELDDFALIIPVVTFTVDSPTKEIGETQASVTFNGTIAPGSFPIVSRVLNPAEGGVEASSPFSFIKTNVKRTTPGLGESHTLTVEDSEGNQTIVTTGVVFKHAFYRGFNALNSVPEAVLKAMTKTLVDNLLQSYGGQQSYVVPASPVGDKYIYWAGPVGTPVIQGAILNNLPLPLVDPGNVVVTNIHDPAVLVEYWVRRTAVRFNPGTYLITLA